MPKVSIILAAQNAQQHIVATVESVLAQTLEDIELIIVDDGSRDDTADICDEYAEKDDRVKVIRQGYTGLGVAYGKGLKTAKGDYIAFVDAGCYLLPEMYETMYTQAVNEEADLVQCGYFVTPQDALTENYPKTQGEVTGYSQRVWFFEEDVAAEDFIMEFIKRGSGEFCNLLAKKSICKSTVFASNVWYGYHYNIDIVIKAKKTQTMMDCLFIRFTQGDEEEERAPVDRLEFVLYSQRLFKALSRFEGNEKQLAEIYYSAMTESEKIHDGEFGKGNAEIAAKLKRAAQFLKDNEACLELIADK